MCLTTKGLKALAILAGELAGKHRHVRLSTITDAVAETDSMFMHDLQSLMKRLNLYTAQTNPQLDLLESEWENLKKNLGVAGPAISPVKSMYARELRKYMGPRNINQPGQELKRAIFYSGDPDRMLSWLRGQQTP